MLITRTRPVESAETAGGDGGFVEGAVLDFGGGIPGFPASRHFRLENLAPELQPFCVMRSVEEPNISFVLVALHHRDR
jgi:flagellar assembly factor FliW